MSPTQIIIASALAVCFPVTFEVRAGTEPEPDSKAVADAAVIPESSGLDVTFVIPGWLTSVEGTMGIKGLETEIDTPFYDIYKNLDMLAAGSIEARSGRLGFIVEGLYLKASFGGTPPGPLLSSASVSVEQVIAEATLTYRIFENDRAWLEFLAGGRYIYLGSELSFSVDQAGIRETSQDLSAAIIDRTTTAVREEISDRLPALLGDLQQQVRADVQKELNQADKKLQRKVDATTRSLQQQAALATGQIQDRVDAKVDEIRESIRDQILEGIGFPGPRFGRGRGSDRRPGLRPEPPTGAIIADSGRVREALKDYVQAQTEAAVAAARSEAANSLANARDRAARKVSAARQKIQRQAESRLAAAEAKLQKEAAAKLARAEANLGKAIEREIKNKIPANPVSASKAWVDPFVGFRGRCDLWEDWYLAARGDIGGFGVSSDLTWNVYGALGVDLTKRTSLELGYRYLSVEYQSGSFLYDMAVKGPFVGVHIEF